MNVEPLQRRQGHEGALRVVVGLRAQHDGLSDVQGGRRRHQGHLALGNLRAETRPAGRVSLLFGARCWSSAWLCLSCKWGPFSNGSTVVLASCSKTQTVSAADHFARQRGAIRSRGARRRTCASTPVARPARPSLRRSPVALRTLEIAHRPRGGAAKPRYSLSQPGRQRKHQ
jgi:hypothetical protein